MTKRLADAPLMGWLFKGIGVFLVGYLLGTTMAYHSSQPANMVSEREARSTEDSSMYLLAGMVGASAVGYGVLDYKTRRNGKRIS